MNDRNKAVLVWGIIILVGIGGYYYFKSNNHRANQETESPEKVAVSKELFANLTQNPLWDVDSRLVLKRAIYDKFGKEKAKGISVDEISGTIYLIGIDFGDKSANFVYRSYWNDKGDMYWKIEELDSKVLQILNNRYKAQQDTMKNDDLKDVDER